MKKKKKERVKKVKGGEPGVQGEATTKGANKAKNKKIDKVKNKKIEDLQQRGLWVQNG